MAVFPLRVFPATFTLRIMRVRWAGFAFSIITSLLTLWWVFLGPGLNFGIDFTGGVMIELRTPEKADLGTMRSALADEAFGEVSLQNFGDDQTVLVRLPVKEGTDQAALVEEVKDSLDHAVSGIDYRQVEFVGPSVGEELVRGGIIAMVLACFAIMAYVWFRFEWQFGVGGILALGHDAIMMVGFYAVTGYDFGLSAVAAILTILGYSINDSVVIYDRIRENLRKYKKMPLDEIIDRSLSETMSRSVMTGLTTMLAAGALVVFGGEVIRGLSLSLLFGVVIGTYSSVFISAPILKYLGVRENAPAAAPARP